MPEGSQFEISTKFHCFGKMMSLTGSLYRERNFWVSSDDTDALNEFPVFSVGKKLAAD